MSNDVPEKYPWELDPQIPKPDWWKPGMVKEPAKVAPGTVLPAWTTSGPSGAVVQGVGAVRPEGVGAHVNSWGSTNAADEKPADVLEGRAPKPVEPPKAAGTAAPSVGDGKQRARL